MTWLNRLLHRPHASTLSGQGVPPVTGPQDVPRSPGAGIAALPKTALMDRVVLAGALGDAWGYTVEFDSVASIDARFGPDGEGLKQPAVTGTLVVSDDTQMTLFTLDGLCRTIATQDRVGSIPVENVRAGLGAAYQAWYSTQMNRIDEPGAWYDQAVMRHRRAPGNTCLGALNARRHGDVPDPINGSKGCGGVMRTAVIGAWPGVTPDQAWALGDAAAAITHGHPDGRWPSAWIAAWVAHAQNQDGLVSPDVPQDGRPTIDRTHAFLGAWDAEAARLLELDPTCGTARLMSLARTLDTTRSWADAWTVLGEGWVGDEALAIAAYAVRRARSFEEAVFRAIYHDGDSDSTGALAAQLWAAWFGIPEDAHPWLERLDVLPAWRRLRLRLPRVD